MERAFALAKAHRLVEWSALPVEAWLAMTDKYTYAFDEETDYELLRDGGEEWVWLTEPEDRTWYRDLAPVVERLNKQDARIAELEADNARLRGELEEIKIRARMAQSRDDNLADEVRAYMLCDIMRHIEQYARAALQEGSD